MTIKLGQEVKDRVSGFKGIATATTRFMQGCDRVLVSPKVAKDGTLPEGRMFDEPDLDVVGDGIKLRPQPKKKTGGPHTHDATISR